MLLSASVYFMWYGIPGLEFPDILVSTKCNSVFWLLYLYPKGMNWTSSWVLWAPNNKRYDGKPSKSFLARFPSTHGLINWDQLWTYKFTLTNTYEFVNCQRNLISSISLFFCRIKQNFWKEVPQIFPPAKGHILLKMRVCDGLINWDPLWTYKFTLANTAEFINCQRKLISPIGKFSCSYYCKAIKKILAVNNWHLAFEATTALLSFSTFSLQSLNIKQRQIFAIISLFLQLPHTQNLQPEL